MRFSIIRTSESYGPPCEGAFRLDPAAEIARDTEWFIEVADLAELMALSKQHGPLIFRAEHEHFDGRIAELPSLEIYDDWQE